MTVRRTGAAVAGMILLALTGCGGEDESPAAVPATTPAKAVPASSEPSEQPVDKETPVVRTKVVMDAQGGGAGKGLCTLFSTAEMSERFGAELGPGEVGGPLDSLCQWSATADTGGNIMIQRVPADYWSPPDRSKGYKALSGIGDKAYSAPGMFDGDWDAAALDGKAVTIASLGGSKANAASATALLMEVLARG